MKKKDLQELRGKTILQMRKELEEKEVELIKLAQEIALQTSKNVHAKRNLRRDIARIKTIIKEGTK